MTSVGRCTARVSRKGELQGCIARCTCQCGPSRSAFLFAWQYACLIDACAVPLLSIGKANHLWKDCLQALEVHQQHTRVPVELVPAGCSPVHFRTDGHDSGLAQLARVKLMVQHDIGVCVQG